MFQAGKNVLTAFLAVNTIFPLIQPSLVSASYSDVDGSASAEATADKQSEARHQTVSGEAVNKNNQPQLIPPYLRTVKIASFKERNEFVYTIRKEPSLIFNQDKGIYAAAANEDMREDMSDDQTVMAVSNEVITIAYVTPMQEVASASTITPDTEDYTLNSDVIFNLVNQHRISIGLQPVERNESIMQIAKERAPELFDEIFVNGNMHAGFYAKNLSYPSSEIIIYYNTEEGAVQWWLNSPIHRGIIQNASYTKAGIACSGKSCSMIFATL